MASDPDHMDEILIEIENATEAWLKKRTYNKKIY